MCAWNFAKRMWLWWWLVTIWISILTFIAGMISNRVVADDHTAIMRQERSTIQQELEDNKKAHSTIEKSLWVVDTKITDVGENVDWLKTFLIKNDR